MFVHESPKKQNRNILYATAITIIFLKKKKKLEIRIVIFVKKKMVASAI